MEKNTVIKVENLSKQYRLGEVGTGTISHDLNRWWYKIRGKEDPYLRIGESNDRSTKGNSEYVWALRDINFEVQQGEVLGIIGKNGAGKSTLLKILSKVTAPTAGSIKAKGRIAALLEVGTGFHPELTGRENIYLNGTILGMTKREVNAKLDEIVDFSGVERYLDTPVKRYSSGMMVRLGFAVAAHLEPEILIVDEVLAVGDADFQKKCLGKMKDVSINEGRTVLFVSHNMAAVTSLCDTCILMKNGEVEEHGKTMTIIDKYIITGRHMDGEVQSSEIKYDQYYEGVKFEAIRIRNKKGLISNNFAINEEIKIEIDYSVLEDGEIISPSVHILDGLGNCILATFNAHSASASRDPFFNIPLKKGNYRAVCTIPAFFLNDLSYTISCFLVSSAKNKLASTSEVLSFTVNETGEMRQEYTGVWTGLIRPRLAWETQKLGS